MPLKMMGAILALFVGGVVLSVALVGSGKSRTEHDGELEAEPTGSLAPIGSCQEAGCHLALELLDRPHIVTAQGQVTDATCLACHRQPDPSEHRFVSVDGAGRVCLQCHDDPRAAHARLHAPVVMGDCIDCHVVHAEPAGPMLNASQADLCGQCHVRFAQALGESERAHEPAVSDCSSCHDGHASNYASLLHAPSPELCRDCHAEVMDGWRQQAVVHEGLFRPGSCHKCHDPHRSDRATLLKASWLDLCLQCHVERVEMPGEPPVAAIGGSVLKAAYRHEPVDAQGCDACHTAHAGPHADLLRAAYPADFYVPFSVEAYALCFDCHDPRVITEPTDAPTGFSDGDRNLHFAHVAGPEKGRACHACHDPHGAGQPHLIRERTRFGTWNMTLRFQPTEFGGACETDCHQPRTYERRPTSPDDEST